MNQKEMRERLALLFKEGRALAEKSEKGDLTADEETRWTAIKAEVEDLRPKLKAAEERASEATMFLDGDNEFNKPQRQERGGNRKPETREESLHKDDLAKQGIAHRFLASQEFKEFRDEGARGAMRSSVEVGSFYHRDVRSLFPLIDGQTPEQREKEIRALIYTGGLPDQFVAPFRIPGVFTPGAPPLGARSVVLNGQTTSNVIQYYRQTSATPTGTFVAEATATGGSSGLKAESSLVWERATAPVETLAHWIPVTNQTLEDDPQIQGIIEGQLYLGLQISEDNAIVNGDGNAPNLTGILNTSGIQTLNDAYFASNPVSDAGEPNEGLNRILRARRLVRTVGLATPTFVLISPADMERMLSLTDAMRNYMVSGGPFGAPAVPTIWRMVAVETISLAEGTCIVGDGTMASVWDRMQAGIKVGTINDQFVRNMQTILAEERLAFSVYRPPAFAAVTLPVS